MAQAADDGLRFLEPNPPTEKYKTRTKLVAGGPFTKRFFSNVFAVQILSDLHIEMGPQADFSFEKKAPYLALLGRKEN
jgi:hypothetical protein